MRFMTISYSTMAMYSLFTRAPGPNPQDRKLQSGIRDDCSTQALTQTFGNPTSVQRSGNDLAYHGIQARQYGQNENTVTPWRHGANPLATHTRITMFVIYQ